MADTAPANISTSDGFPSSIVDFYISKKIQDHGESTYRFREAAEKNVLPAGNGTNIKFIRYNRLVVPTALTEGVEPDGDALDVATVTGNCQQLGQVVKISDVLELTMWHPVVRRAMDELAESAARKDDALIQEVLLGAANVMYPGSATSQAEVLAPSITTDPPQGIIDTALLRKAIALLDVGATNTFDGGARTYSDGLYKGIIHRKHMLDLMDDTVWSAMAQRQDKGALEKGEILLWSKTKFQATNFGPQITQADFSAAVAGSTTGTPGDLDDGDYLWAITAVNKKTGFEDTIDSFTSGTATPHVVEDVLSTGGADGAVTITFSGLDSDFTYNVYFANEEGTGVNAKALLHSEGNKTTDDALVITDLQTTGREVPDAPTDSTDATHADTIYTSYILGADSFSVVDLSSLKTFMVKGASKSDPLDQQRTMGTKWFDTALILNDAFLVRLEAGSQY